MHAEVGPFWMPITTVEGEAGESGGQSVEKIDSGIVDEGKMPDK